MKQNKKLNKLTDIESATFPQSVIGLYEMLAQAQPVTSKENTTFLDDSSFDVDLSKISDD